MKNRSLFTIVAFTTSIIISINCKKELPLENTSPGSQQLPPVPNPTPPSAPVPQVNTAPVANAGPDQRIYEPSSATTLWGSAVDVDNNIVTINWRKISGPPGGEIQNQFSPETIVRNLVSGTYQFELTVKDSGGLEARDVCQITVQPLLITGDTIILPNRTWIFPWYSAIEIANFSQINPTARPFSLFIKRDNQAIWNLVTPINMVSTAEYEYFIEIRPDGAGMYTYGSLYIYYYGADVSDTPDVKIQF